MIPLNCFGIIVIPAVVQQHRGLFFSSRMNSPPSTPSDVVILVQQQRNPRTTWFWWRWALDCALSAAITASISNCTNTIWFIIIIFFFWNIFFPYILFLFGLFTALESASSRFYAYNQPQIRFRFVCTIFFFNWFGFIFQIDLSNRPMSTELHFKYQFLVFQKLGFNCRLIELTELNRT